MMWTRKGWIVILTLLFLGFFLPIRSHTQSRIPADTGDVNPFNPPRFKGFRVSPSSIVQFYFSEAGKRFLMGSPNPQIRDMGRLVVGNGSFRASSIRQPIFGVRVPSFDPGVISLVCGSVVGCKFNLEAATNAVSQNEESVDFILGGGLAGEDLVVQGANDYRFGGTLGSATGYYVSRDADGTPEFEGGLPGVPDPLEGGDILVGGGDPVIAADPERSAFFAADLRFDFSTSGIGVFRTTTAKLNSALPTDCPDGTHTETQAAGCWPTKRVVNAQPSQGQSVFFEDKPHLAVDERAAGVGAGNVYVTATEFAGTEVAGNPLASRIWLVACDNTLAACSAPIIVSGSDSATQFSHVAVRPDGGVTVTYVDVTSDAPPPGFFPELYQVFNIKYVRCTPAAAPATPSCSPATLVHSETQPLAFGGFLAAQDFKVVTYPKHDHRMDGGGTETYVVWDRCKIDPSANPDLIFHLFCPDADVVAKGSTDNGVTWSGVFSINATPQDQFFPWIKTERSPRGIINIVYYNSGADPTYQYRVQLYLNHISPNGVLDVDPINDTHILASTLNAPSADPLQGGFFFGDYIGVAARGTGVDGASRAYCGFTYNDVQGLYGGVSAPQQDNKLSRLDY